MAGFGWLDRLISSFGAIVRRQGWFGWRQSSDREVIKPEDRAQSLLPLIQSNFSKQQIRLVDLAPLEECLQDESSYDSLAELITLFGVRNIPFDSARLADWHKLAIPPSTLYGVFELTQPSTLEDLDFLLSALRENLSRIRLEVLRPIASIFQTLKRPLAIGNLSLAIQMLGGSEVSHQTASFLACAEAYAEIGPVDHRLDKLLLERTKDEEALAASATMFDVIGAHMGKVEAYDDIRDLLEGVTDRITVRRLSKVLALFEEYGVKAGGLDTFQLTFANTQGDLEWLERALKGMKDLGRPIDRVALMQLREWAPEIGALGRYLTAVRAFQGLGLEVDEIDRLVLKRVESEEKSQVLGQIGELWFRLGFGAITLERAEHLADTLVDRSRLKRYETAVGLLRDLKLSPSDVEILAEQFFEETDDINWLEAVVASASEAEDRLGRLQILHLRERCPEPPHLYRYFKLKRAFAWFPGDAAALEKWLVDIAPIPDRTGNVLALADILQHDPGKLSLTELKEFDETYGNQELVEAFGTCVRTFNGDWRRFNVFLNQVRESGDIQATFAILSRTFGDARMSGNQFERALELLIHQTGKSSVSPNPS